MKFKFPFKYLKTFIFHSFAFFPCSLFSRVCKLAFTYAESVARAVELAHLSELQTLKLSSASFNLFSMLFSLLFSFILPNNLMQVLVVGFTSMELKLNSTHPLYVSKEEPWVCVHSQLKKTNIHDNEQQQTLSRRRREKKTARGWIWIQVCAKATNGNMLNLPAVVMMMIWYEQRAGKTQGGEEGWNMEKINSFFLRSFLYTLCTNVVVAGALE